MLYPNDLTVEQARELYFQRSGFNTDTYTDRWVKLPLGSFHFYLPNFRARREAVPLHDIDHVLTEYPTTWRGEYQISAFEIGSGCGCYWAGWMINLQGIVIGSLLFPKDLLRAFARGRRSRGVYGCRDYKTLLGRKVGDLRADLIASDQAEITAWDSVLFFSWVLLSIALHLAPILLTYAVYSRLG